MELKIEPIFKGWLLALFPKAMFARSPHHGNRLAIVTNERSVSGINWIPMANLFAMATDIILVNGTITLILDREHTDNLIINTPKEKES